MKKLLGEALSLALLSNENNKMSSHMGSAPCHLS